MKPFSSQLRFLAAIFVCSLAVAACGGGDDTASDSPSEAAKDSTTTSTTSTTLPERPDADLATIDLAKASVYMLEDLGEPWTVVETDNSNNTTNQAHECLNPTDGLRYQLGTGAVLRGDSFKRGDENFFVGTVANVFDSVEDASEWAEFLVTEPHLECQRATFEARNQNEDGTLTVETLPADDVTGDGSDGAPVMVEKFEFLIDGEASHHVYVYNYRYDNVILQVQIDVASDNQEVIDSTLR